VIILSETTGTTSAILPLFATCLIADWAGALVCRERLYHALARDFMPVPAAAPKAAEEENRYA
jgi:H+/Cl- antiporter ClcA